MLPIPPRLQAQFEAHLGTGPLTGLMGIPSFFYFELNFKV